MIRNRGTSMLRDRGVANDKNYGVFHKLTAKKNFASGFKICSFTRQPLTRGNS